MKGNLRQDFKSLYANTQLWTHIWLLAQDLLIKISVENTFYTSQIRGGGVVGKGKSSYFTLGQFVIILFLHFFLKDIQSAWRPILLVNILSKLALEFYTIQTRYIYIPLHVISEQLAQSWSDLWSHGNAFKSSGNCDWGSFWQPDSMGPSGVGLAS